MKSPQTYHYYDHAQKSPFNPVAKKGRKSPYSLKSGTYDWPSTLFDDKEEKEQNNQGEKDNNDDESVTFDHSKISVDAVWEEFVEEHPTFSFLVDNDDGDDNDMLSSSSSSEDSLLPSIEEVAASIPVVVVQEKEEEDEEDEEKTTTYRAFKEAMEDYIQNIDISLKLPVTDISIAEKTNTYVLYNYSVPSIYETLEHFLRRKKSQVPNEDRVALALRLCQQIYKVQSENPITYPITKFDVMINYDEQSHKILEVKLKPFSREPKQIGMEENLRNLLSIFEKNVATTYRRLIETMRCILQEEKNNEDPDRWFISTRLSDLEEDLEKAINDRDKRRAYLAKRKKKNDNNNNETTQRNKRVKV